MYVDLQANEEVRIKANSAPNVTENVHMVKETANQAFAIAPAFALAPNETKVFEGSFQIPHNFQPSYSGHHTTCEWRVRGRIEAFGNDPDSGYLPFRVGLRG